LFLKIILEIGLKVLKKDAFRVSNYWREIVTLFKRTRRF